MPSYSYTTEPDAAEPKKTYDYKPEENSADKYERLNIPYSPLLNKFKDEDLEIISKLVNKFRSSGNIDISYKSGWQGPLFAYLIEFLGMEAKSGNPKAAIKLENIFNPNNSKDLWMLLVRSYNKTKAANERKTLINNKNNKGVKEAMNKFAEGRVILKFFDNYKSKGGNDYLAKFLIKHMQLRFFNNYEAYLKRINNSKTKAPVKNKIHQEKKYRSTYSISDIQKYLYAGNDGENKNDNFIKFNKANKEILFTLKSSKKKVNDIYIALIDGIINSKLDQEEIMEINPGMFKDIKDVSRKFSNTVKSGRVNGVLISDYMDGIYKKHGLELPSVKTWKTKDISSSQDPTKKLKDDKMGYIFKEIREILKDII